MRELIATICILAMVSLVINVAVRAGTEATVTVSVIPGSYSVSVATSTYDYGSMLINSTASSSDDIATNDGQLTEKLQIKGADAATTSPYIWTLSEDIGTDIYTHAFTAIDGLVTGAATGTDPETSWVALGTGYQTLAASVAQSGTKQFWLDIRTPSAAGASTTYGEIYETTVTVLAAAP